MKRLSLIAVSALALGAVVGCNEQKAPQLTKSGLNPENFKSVCDGDSTALFVLTNANGAEVCITNFGGRIVSAMMPDRNGELRDVVIGMDSVQAYFPENNQSDFGASIGRYANRINQGRFVLDGDTAKLPQNNFGHCLHGGTDMGTRGWQYRVYSPVEVTDSSLTLAIESPDGDNGFPGKVDATVKFTLTANNGIAIEYGAVTDAPTIINMTNHSYFNLSGDFTKPVTDEILQINASNYTPVDSTFMTTGEILPVAGTPMDFTTPKPIGAEIENFDFEQLKNGNGYDHNWVLDTKGDASVPAARLYSPESGIAMEVFTNEPGVQVYTGNFLDGSVSTKKGIVPQQRAAICLETQHYPDSPNKPEWPSVVLRPGETYNSYCLFQFSTAD